MGVGVDNSKPYKYNICMENVMRRVNYYVTEIQAIKLKVLSEATGLSVSEHIRRAIDLYLKELRYGQAKGIEKQT
jgi:hypothetical protein